MARYCAGMSQGNLERLRRGHEGFTRGDISSLRENVADDVDWGTTGAFPGLDESYLGPEALERWMEAVRSAWESFEVEIDEVVRDADDVLVITERLWGRGRGSGVETEMQIFSVYWFDEGQIVRRRVFDSREDALEAAGLSE
jgi:ketosteroid isomerase-like protein